MNTKNYQTHYTNTGNTEPWTEETKGTKDSYSEDGNQ